MVRKTGIVSLRICLCRSVAVVQSPVHTNNNVEAKFDFLPKTTTMSNEFIVQKLIRR